MHTHPGERPSLVRSFAMIEETSLRRRMEAAIESMLELLDQLDGDAELEPDNDEEPNLGWEGGQPSRYFFVAPWDDSSRRYDDIDREVDAGDEPEGPDTDREYTALERHGMGFAYSGPDDAEEQHDAEEDPAEAGHCDVSEAIHQRPRFIGEVVR